MVTTPLLFIRFACMCLLACKPGIAFLLKFSNALHVGRKLRWGPCKPHLHEFPPCRPQRCNSSVYNLPKFLHCSINFNCGWSVLQKTKALFKGLFGNYPITAAVSHSSAFAWNATVLLLLLLLLYLLKSLLQIGNVIPHALADDFHAVHPS